MLDGDKKQEERTWAKAAANILSEEWRLEDSESPDFIVSSPDGRFGLEVTKCFAGSYTRGGSTAAQGAQYRQKALNEIRRRCLGKFPMIKYWGLEYIDD
jgi:hypothetical protein